MDGTMGNARAGKKTGKTDRATLAERFVDYHAKRPETYEQFKHHARRLRYGRRLRRISAQYICDYLAFETGVDMRPDDDYKLNHDFGPFYARMLRHEDETYGAYFEYRRSVADEVDLAALVKTVD